MMYGNILYDSFNARYLSYTEIAKLFIVNSQYNELIKSSHSLLMGPRGSGKTTLLKMLTIPAQHFAKNEVKGNLDHPPFIAIYIPTDVHWKKQLDEFELEFSQLPKYRDVITKLVVTTNILVSTCQTFIDFLDFKEKCENDLINEAELAKILIKDWKLRKPIANNLWAVKHALLSRLSEINVHIKKVRILNKSEEQIKYEEYFFDDYLDTVTLACDAFEQIFSKDPSINMENIKWALCFDELEIAPSWLQIELLGKLRSIANQRIFFKLTMVPLVMLDLGNNEFGEVKAREKEDFNIIRTWTYSKTSIDNWEKFSRKLIEDKFIRKGNISFPLSLFGADNLDRNIDLTFSGSEGYFQKNGYSPGSRIWFLFKELAFIDSSFRDFLRGYKIQANNPVPYEVGQRDSIFRKIKPIVLHRFQFRSHIIGKMRSRKNASLYYGLPRLYQLCDGNPRALIGMIDEFIEIYLAGKHPEEKFDINLQSKVVTEISEKYLNLLKNHPDANVKYFTKYINLGIILERIGNYFKDRLLSDDFTMDPVNCFVIDKDTPIEIVELLKVAMHLGAIIYLNPDESLSKTNLIGKKFRLSFLLFPNYRLPIVEYGSINLSKILKKGTDKIDQLLLFENN